MLFINIIIHIIKKMKTFLIMFLVLTIIEYGHIKKFTFEKN